MILVAENSELFFKCLANISSLLFLKIAVNFSDSSRGLFHSNMADDVNVP
jgi:hypothetical protein